MRDGSKRRCLHLDPLKPRLKSPFLEIASQVQASCGCTNKKASKHEASKKKHRREVKERVNGELGVRIESTG